MGLNSIAYFAPDPRLLATNSIAGFKTMVKRLHDAGIEVILDVVTITARRQSPRPDAVVPRHRQCLLLSIGNRPAILTTMSLAG